MLKPNTCNCHTCMAMDLYLDSMARIWQTSTVSAKDWCCCYTTPCCWLATMYFSVAFPIVFPVSVYFLINLWQLLIIRLGAWWIGESEKATWNEYYTECMYRKLYIFTIPIESEWRSMCDNCKSSYMLGFNMLYLYGMV